MTASFLDDLFAKVYTSANGDTVKSANDDKVIAPGTENSVDFSFAYNTTSNTIAAPEVAYTFKVEVDTNGDTTKLDLNDSFKWTLDGNKYNTLEALVDAIKKLSGILPVLRCTLLVSFLKLSMALLQLSMVPLSIRSAGSGHLKVRM